LPKVIYIRKSGSLGYLSPMSARMLGHAQATSVPQAVKTWMPIMRDEALLEEPSINQ
jgi:hypothetical protein